MANEEIKTFNVYNNSVRLVHIGGVQIMPERVASLVDDAGGINRAGVESCEFLDFTDAEATEVIVEGVAPKVKPKTVAKTSTATGAGWTAKA
ncbi:MAG: hypothetical protein V4493_01275 [Pseudomonadota bacterium]